MKSAFVLLLIFALILCNFSAVGFAEGALPLPKTYGADNLNNQTGDLIIGFLGGSITVGAGASPNSNRWSTLVTKEYFKSKYPNKNVIERNAGISGTSSSYGLARIKRDLELDTDKTPDVVFIEYCVNDKRFSKDLIAKNYDSMIRQLFSLPKVPVIIFIYATSADSMENPIAYTKLVADHYGIYGVDLHQYVKELESEGKYQWTPGSPNSISGDGTHPNTVGHRIYADRIIELLKRDEESAFKKLDISTPPCFKDYVIGELDYIPFNDDKVIKNGEWQKVPVNTQASATLNRILKDGYLHADDGTKVSGSFSFTGRGIGIDYAKTGSSANLSYKIKDSNGAVVASGSVSLYSKNYTIKSGRCEGQMLKTGLPPGTYTFEFTGVFNSQAVTDYNANPSTGGSGLELNLGYLFVEKTPPRLSFSGPVEIEVDGIAKSAPGIGTNKFSAEIKNNGSASANVIFLAATYRTFGNISYMSGIKKTSKTINSGQTEKFSVAITAVEADTEIKLLAFDADSLEPILQSAMKFLLH